MLLVEIPCSLSLETIVSPSLSSPTQQWRLTCIPKDLNPIAICAAAPGVSSVLIIFRTGTGAVESRLLA